MPGERELRFAYPNLWTRRLQGHRRGEAARAITPSSRAGSSCIPRVAAPRRRKRSAGTSRSPARRARPRSRYRRAAEAARAQFANERAIRLFDRALACIGDADLAARIHIWHDLGSVYELIGDFEAALGAFERMLRLSWVAASKTKAAVAFNKMGRVWRRKGDLKLALEYLERGHELFRAAGDSARHRGLARRHRQVAADARPLRRGARQDHRGARASRQARRQARDRDLAVAARRRPAGSRPLRVGLRLPQGRARAAQGRPAIAGAQVVSQNNLAALAFELGDLAEARAGLARRAARGRGDRRAAARRADPDEPRRARARREQARGGAQPARASARDHRGHRGSRARVRVLPSPRARSRSCRATPQVARELAERALAVAKQGRPAREGGPGAT